MSVRPNILLQTTIPFTEDDWNIGRFSLLRAHLESLTNAKGERLYNVTARDREIDAEGNDRVLSRLDETTFDELWLFAVDVGDGLSEADCAGLTRFRQRGGGILSARDHADLGSSLCTLGGIGAAHYFHTRNLDPDTSRQERDDPDNLTIDFPNYHSGNNGDFQRIKPAGAVHDLLRRSDGEPIEFFPSHPHEGGVGTGANGENSRVIATGTSSATGREFNLVVAFETGRGAIGNKLGRGVAESSFHHLVDYNWDTDAGSPTFVTEKPGTGYKVQPDALSDVKQYVSNVAAWLRG